MSDLNNRRFETRRKLMAFTPVYDLHPRFLMGYLGDMTLKGALIIGTNLVTVNKQTTLEIQFPSDMPGVAMLKAEIPARIAWCRQDESPQYYNIGVQFTDVSPENEDLFIRILQRYHFRYILTDTDFEAE